MIKRFKELKFLSLEIIDIKLYIAPNYSNELIPLPRTKNPFSLYFRYYFRVFSA